ncbi:hypothetical protein [Microbacterium yannicii]|uniref:hypothetical protein n=1 Tax=Microbacterium yannicii TaxID=671622 RepID=UPI0003642CF1|nr:hypothetical protein [Microbacterium yannicii]
MSESRPAAAPGWVRTVIWLLAIAVAVIGVVAAVASSSWLPLVLFAGLFLPMLPLGTRRTTR